MCCLSIGQTATEVLSWALACAHGLLSLLSASFPASKCSCCVVFGARGFEDVLPSTTAVQHQVYI